MKVLFTEKRHDALIMEALDKQRKTREFCDVVIRVDRNDFYAHLNVLAVVSSQVRSLIFRNDMKADDELLIVIDSEFMSSDLVEELLNYFYTGMILISDINVEELVKGTKYFSNKTLESHCSNFLLRTLGKKNCFKYLLLSMKYNLKEVVYPAYDCTRDHFYYLAGPQHVGELMFCPPLVFRKLLKDEDLHAQNEDQVFLVLIEWVKHKKADRQNLFKKYLRYVRLSAVSTRTLLISCREILLFTEHGGPLAQIESILSERKQGEPQNLMLNQRKGALMDAVVILGGQKQQGTFSTGVFAYILGENIWLKLTELPYGASGLSATSLGKYIYVSGGTNEQISSLKSAWKYNVDANSWHILPDLPTGLVFHTMVTCGGAVYSVGGSTAPRKYISSIYKYNDVKEKWVLAGKMSIRMDATALITKEDKTIYIVTGRCLVNEVISRVGVLECFDTVTRNVMQCTTFPIQFTQKPLLSFLQSNVLCVQSHKESVEINLKTIQTNKSTKYVPFLPNNNRLDLSHAVCPVDKDKVFVCGGLICPGDQPPEGHSINRGAYMLDRSIGAWRLLAPPPEALDCPACCTIKLPCEVLQKTAS